MLQMKMQLEVGSSISGDSGGGTGSSGINTDLDVQCLEEALPIPSSIPNRIAKTLQCVGFASLDDWQAVIMLQAEQEHTATASGTSNNNNPNANAMIRRQVSTSNSNASVGSSNSATTTTTGTTTDGTASLSTISSAPVSTTTTTTKGPTSSSNPNNPQLPQWQEEEGEDQEEVEAVAWLVLQHRQDNTRIFSKPLSFRPLSPCLCHLPAGDYSSDDDDDDNSSSVGVWVGSADDSQLRLYQVQGEALVQVPFQFEGKDTMKFQTPIMAVSWLGLSSSSTNKEEETKKEGEASTPISCFLGVACQDGTVRFLDFTWNRHRTRTNSVALALELTVVVDGPIVAMHLARKDDNTIEAIIGSLCGYVARFLKTTNANNNTSNNWQGPFMVAEGFTFQKQEDSVLSVHCWDDKVAVGTVSGRCLLYGHQHQQQQQGGDDDDYGLPFWDCKLPAPIHGICPIRLSNAPRDPGTHSLLLLITTRRSVHIFQESPQAYNPKKTRRKLGALLARLLPKETTTTSAVTLPATESKNLSDSNEQSTASPGAAGTNSTSTGGDGSGASVALTAEATKECPQDQTELNRSSG